MGTQRYHWSYLFQHCEGRLGYGFLMCDGWMIVMEGGGGRYSPALYLDGSLNEEKLLRSSLVPSRVSMSTPCGLCMSLDLLEAGRAAP